MCTLGPKKFVDIEKQFGPKLYDSRWDCGTKRNESNKLCMNRGKFELI